MLDAGEAKSFYFNRRSFCVGIIIEQTDRWDDEKDYSQENNNDATKEPSFLLSIMHKRCKVRGSS